MWWLRWANSWRRSVMVNPRHAAVWAIRPSRGRLVGMNRRWATRPTSSGSDVSTIRVPSRICTGSDGVGSAFLGEVTEVKGGGRYAAHAGVVAVGRMVPKRQHICGHLPSIGTGSVAVRGGGPRFSSVPARPKMGEVFLTL